MKYTARIGFVTTIAAVLILVWPSASNSNFDLHDTEIYEEQSAVRSYSRSLQETKISDALMSAENLGTNSFIHNRTIFGALLPCMHTHKHGGGKSEHLMTSNRSEFNNQNKHLIQAEFGVGVSEMKQATKKLPFPVVRWPHVITKACPSHRLKPSADGVNKLLPVEALAHYAVWIEFMFFDHDVIQALERKEIKKNILYNSTSYSSDSGHFSASIDGLLYKNGLPFLEEDILVVFEDHTHVAISNVSQSLRAELSSMTTDLLYLGWREPTESGATPLSTYAYAITRRGARKAVEYFDPCRQSLEEQFAIMTKHGWLSYRQADPMNYYESIDDPLITLGGGLDNGHGLFRNYEIHDSTL